MAEKVVFNVAHKAMTVTKVQNQVPTRHHVFHRSCLSCASCRRALHMSNLFEGPGEHKLILIIIDMLMLMLIMAIMIIVPYTCPTCSRDLVNISLC